MGRCPRKSYPKQFVPLVGETTLFQASALRLSGEGFAAPMVLTNSDFRFIVTEQLAEAGIDPGAILIEPAGRNTAPAVLAAALWLRARDPEGLMLVAPSDHVVPDAAAFRAAVAAAEPAARAGELVTFGIKPDRAETGYGLSRTGWRSRRFQPKVIGLQTFCRKNRIWPPPRICWPPVSSCGTQASFLFSVKAIIAAFETHAPDLMAPVQGAVDQGEPDLGFLRLDPAAWDGAADISIDYAVMERAENLAVVPYAGGWSDLGGWDAVWRESGPDGDGIVTQGRATAIECSNSLLRSEDDGLEVVGIGLKDVIAVAMPDAVLVADASRAQEVKKAVAALKAKSARQAEAFPKDHRPWGWFESLVVGERFQVKRIHVHPGAALSLQSHHHRSEHWIVVEGTAKVTVDDSVQLVSENQSVYIPLGAVHRMENPGKVPMVLIEVQTGSYLGEDDIIRYEDIYARK
ncbi:mannose-1-phosphate guanylyltransferase/mannose-6-phosphate isomerase [Phaeobacter inhibens]|uniref:mannose-1-phosphate guanylyltransferase/mannose-6-phosphate isomerase n=1 Tax=Phaeobacter inhibens TaxID=221822 RepID=UPI0021A7BF9B|nr:mannose-1-phosphate guanylyltransferase/mannose-6-phosphate isomerase [Phaeobacter inhibens]